MTSLITKVNNSSSAANNYTENTKKDFQNKNLQSKLEIKNVDSDKFQKELPQNDLTVKTEIDNDTADNPKTKKHLFRNISLGIVSTVVAIYGGIVLKRKLSKPTFEEVQQCFKAIFGKDLSKEELSNVLQKYKDICKSSSTDEFIQQIIAQLKKDYGIDEVATKLEITKLKDNKISTAINQTTMGTASPIGEINIMPRTPDNTIIRSIQKDAFLTGIHEIMHLRQFADAYRADQEKFAEALYEKNIAQMIPEQVASFKADILKDAKEIKQGTSSMFDEILETEGPQKAQEAKDYFMNLSLEEIEKYLRSQLNINTEEEMTEYIIEIFKKTCRTLLDERYGMLKPYEKGSPEYGRGLRYIEGYREYPDPKTDYEAYERNILEAEAFGSEKFAKKIYNYISSIWKL